MSREAALANESARSAPDELVGRATSLLSELLRLDTSNPPGAERGAQELLRAVLDEAGFECELVGREPERPNLVARLSSGAPGPSLCILGHADTVPANADEWSFDPWVGDVVDGMVRGRGAQDMKGQVAAEISACAALALSGWRPRRGELLVVITADEEMGGGFGARWLCEERPDLVRCDYVLNEGGGVAVDFGGRRFYTLALGEKGVFRFQLRARGTAGHASVPRNGDNALIKLAALIGRLAERQPPPEPTPEGVALMSVLLDSEIDADPATLADALAEIETRDPALAAFLVEPALSVTLSPTKARASEKANVIPSVAETLVDCRVPPGWGEAEVLDRVQGIVGAEAGEIEFVDRIVGNISPLDSPLADALGEWLGASDPGSGIVPAVMPGFSDSHWFRKAFGAVAYGFSPIRAFSLGEVVPLFHGADERIPVDDLALAARFFYEMPPRMLG